MATFTTNYNLKKPDGTDFYNIEDFNSNTDIIDEQLKTLSDSIEKNGFKNMGINGVNIDDVFNYNYVVGLTDDKYGTRPEQSWIIVQNFCATNFIVQTAMKVQNGGTANDNKMWMRNKYSNGTWSGWSQIFSEGAPPTAAQVGALPITGGTLSGELYIGNGHGRLFANNKMALFDVTAALEDSTTRRRLTIYSPAQSTDITKAVQFETYVNGAKNYLIFGEHNKPTGTYTGNGNATARTVNVNGSGSVVIIRGSNGAFGIVSPTGGIFRNGTSIVGVVEGEIQANNINGNITIKSTNALFNASGVTYYYYLT